MVKPSNRLTLVNLRSWYCFNLIKDFTMSANAKKNILERLNDGEVIVGDGGYVFELEKRGYATGGHWTPEASVEYPDAVEGLHKEFARAGSDVLQAFTFYGSEDHLEKTNIDTKAHSVNEASCHIVKKVSKETGCLWAGGLSATALYHEGATKKQIQDFFLAQSKIFIDENADFLIAEYFQYCEEIEWAVEILKQTGKPIAATMCINSTSDNKGVPTDECAVRLVKAGADIIGINCKFDPQESLRAIKKMKEGLEKAGLKAHLMLQTLGFHCPDATGLKYGYLELPENPFAMEPRSLRRWDVHKIARSAYDLGVRYIGGCCGYKAYHIRAIAEELAPERGRLPAGSEKHKPFELNELYVGDTTGVRSKEFWMNLKGNTAWNKN